MKRRLNDLIASPYFSFFVTVALFAILYGAGIMAYKGFSRPQVFLNLFAECFHNTVKRGIGIH